MNGLDFNKVFMALGFTLLAIFGIHEFSGAVFEKDEAQPQFASAPAAGETGGEAAPAEEAVPDFGVVLASADLEAGAKVARQCAQCHTWDQGGANKIGPNLFGIIGAKHGHMDGFAYSEAIKSLPGNWDYESLYKFLKRPGAYAPGTKMAFAGLRKSEDRINLIAYIRTWAASPAPLPAPGPAPAEAPSPSPETPAPAETPAAPH